MSEMKALRGRGARKENAVSLVLAGNPNVGKSTVFNCLTGMHQHTGNWAGKTVASAEGRWRLGETDILLVDAPGCYSLRASSAEEEVARDCILDPRHAGVIVVCDATCLERNLILALQILSHRDDVVLCVNLMDQARRQGLVIDTGRLSALLGVKVIATEAGRRKDLRRQLEEAAAGLLAQREKRMIRARQYVPELLPETGETAARAQEIAAAAVRKKEDGRRRQERATAPGARIDRLMTSPYTAFPLMALMLLFIFWLTVQGANYPSAVLSELLFSWEEPLHDGLASLGLAAGLCDMLAYGMYRVLAWVVSVMLPPMAIFFPLFTLLEDWGFLPRIAFNLDRCFCCCHACGKQALTMCMGLGCNAAAVVSSRIIDSRRERLLAILTNSLMPCNGRFPLLIAVITMFFAGGAGTGGAGTGGSVFGDAGVRGALMLTGLVIFSVLLTLALTKLLAATVLAGERSTFTLELPPFRRPQLGRVIVRSVFDRTVFVLARAAAVAAPAGLVIYVLANVEVGGVSLIESAAALLDPLGQLMGLDGVILMAFILGLPANEIVLPLAMMIYLSRGTLAEAADLQAFHDLLVANGWTALTALNVMIFSLAHWPCATTLLSIRKEAGGWRWAALAFCAPLALGIACCCLTTAFCKFFL